MHRGPLRPTPLERKKKERGGGREKRAILYIYILQPPQFSASPCSANATNSPEIEIPIIKTINSGESVHSGIMFTASLNIPDPSWSSGLYLQIN